MPFFSIITVVFNGQNCINKTLESLAKQNFSDYELIIIDGGSTDYSLLEIEKIKVKFHLIKIVSETDDGIYYAMNKGINLSTGKIIYFLNCNDSLIDNFVLSDIFNFFRENNKVDILYGNFKDQYGKIHVQVRKPSKILFTLDRFINHQSIFAKRHTFENNLFDTNFRISADHNWISLCFKKKFIFKNIYRTIINYDTKGFSSKNKKLLMLEHELINLRNGKFYFFLNSFKHKLSLFLRKL